MAGQFVRYVPASRRTDTDCRELFRYRPYEVVRSNRYAVTTVIVNGRGAAWRRSRHVIRRPGSPAAHPTTPGVRGAVGREPGSATRSRRHERKGSRRLPRAVGATGRRLRRTGGPSARSRGGVAATGQEAGGAGTSRGAATRGHYRPPRGRSAWFERRDASFVIAGNRRCPACSHSDYCTSFRYRPHDDVRSYRYTGTVITIRTRCVLTTLPDYVRQTARIRRQHHERASLSRTTASREQRGDGVASSRASGRRGGEPASNGTAEPSRGPRTEAESTEGVLPLPALHDPSFEH